MPLIATAASAFFLLWWVVLFAVLPWGVHSQHEDTEALPGTDPGAPILPMLGRKLALTTMITAAIFAGCYVVYASHLVNLDALLAHAGLNFGR
jgi:predicted secreted protein